MGREGKNLTSSPSSERLERAILRIARAVLAGKNRQILELYKLLKKKIEKGYDVFFFGTSNHNKRKNTFLRVSCTIIIF